MTYLIWYYVITTILFLLVAKDSPAPLFFFIFWPILLPVGLLAALIVGDKLNED